MKFIDLAEIEIKAGDGGKGHISFRREKFVPKGGPDGGNGGKGGNVVVQGNPHMNTLLDFKFIRHLNAEDGVAGQKNNRTGRNGKDKVIKVPVGTIVKDSNTGEILADITEPNQKEIIASGGIGGKGNAEFVTATKQAPRYAQPGMPGDEKTITLELKLLADVGLVGLPNVGKSTLISVLSAAKPKIADYHFTTLIPNLGVAKIDEGKSFVIADIPGLIEGASQGKGLGHQFLRHVERSKVLVFLIEAFSEDPIRDYNILNEEINNFNPDMKYKKKIFCISKVDALSPEELDKLKKIRFDQESPHLLISAVSQKNIEELKHLMWDYVVTNTDDEG